MNAKLEWTQSSAQQNIEQLQNPKMGVTINNQSTTTEPPPYTGQQSIHWGALIAFNWYQIFAIDSAVVEAQKAKFCHIFATFYECLFITLQNTLIRSNYMRK